MWGVLLRLGSRYAFFRRWKKVILFSGMMLLCIIAALLIDAKMYLSAGLICFLVAVALVFFLVQLFQGRRAGRERERRKLAEVARRAAAAQARSEKFDRAKATFADAARTATSSAANAADR